MWAEAEADLGVDVIAPYRVDTIDCSAYFPQFGDRSGSPRGTLVLVGDLFDYYWQHARELGALGYLASFWGCRVYDRDAFIEPLTEYGWLGPIESAPGWYREFRDD